MIGSNPASGEIVVIAGLGRSADWYRNVQANPPPASHASPTPPVAIRFAPPEGAVGRESFRPVARQLDEDEAATVVAGYERRNRLVAPVVRRVLSWLVGWRYDGSEAARGRLVRELPVVAFRPAARS